MASREFILKFRALSSIDDPPCISMQRIHILKHAFMQPFITEENINPLGQPGRLLASWIETALEFLHIKHETMVLALKKKNVLGSIDRLATEWPKKKEMLQAGFLFFQFTPTVSPEVRICL